jgi:hypothetical protein
LFSSPCTCTRFARSRRSSGTLSSLLAMAFAAMHPNLCKFKSSDGFAGPVDDDDDDDDEGAVW